MVRAAVSGPSHRRRRLRSPLPWRMLPSGTPPIWPSTTTSSTATSTASRRPIACAPWGTGRSWWARTSPTDRNQWKRWCGDGSTAPGTARTSWTRGSQRWASRTPPAVQAGTVCTGYRCSPSLRRNVRRALLLQRRDAGLAGRLVLRARATGAPDPAHHPAPLDERDTAAGCDHPIEGQHVVEPIRLYGVLPRLGFAAERNRGARFVFGDRNRGELGAVHALEGHEVAAGVHHRDIQLPVALLRLGDHCIDGDRGPFERNGWAVGHIERHLVRHHIERVAARSRCRSVLRTPGGREEHRAECREDCEPDHACFSLMLLRVGTDAPEPTPTAQLVHC